MRRVLLVLFLCLTVIAFFGCKKETDEEQVKKVAHKYFEAVKKGDVNAFKALLDEKSLKHLDPEAEKVMTESLKILEKLDFLITYVTVTDEIAKVNYIAKMTIQGKEGSKRGSLQMVKVNGVWKITTEDYFNTVAEPTPQKK